MPKQITVIQDSREQKPWIFDLETKVKSSYKSQIVSNKVDTIDAGDYTLEGYENLLRIERKQSFCELFGNMIPIANKERFEREMDRMKDIPHKYIIIESNLSNEILGLSVPQMKYPVPISRVYKWLLELQNVYNIHILNVGDAGKKVARYIFDQIVRIYD